MRPHVNALTGNSLISGELVLKLIGNSLISGELVSTLIENSLISGELLPRLCDTVYHDRSDFLTRHVFSVQSSGYIQLITCLLFFLLHFISTTTDTNVHNIYRI